MWRFMWWIIAIVVLVALAFVFFFPPRKFNLFSEVRGVVLRDGTPVQGAEVERTYRWAWKDETKTEKVATDREGKFSFGSAVGSARLASFLPHEPVVTQKIFIREGGKEYEAWLYTKHNYTENGELKGRKINLMCRLESEPSFKDEVYGICTIEK